MLVLLEIQLHLSYSEICKQGQMKFADKLKFLYVQRLEVPIFATKYFDETINSNCIGVEVPSKQLPQYQEFIKTDKTSLKYQVKQ